MRTNPQIEDALAEYAYLQALGVCRSPGRSAGLEVDAGEGNLGPGQSEGRARMWVDAARAIIEAETPRRDTPARSVALG